MQKGRKVESAVFWQEILFVTFAGVRSRCLRHHAVTPALNVNLIAYATEQRRGGVKDIFSRDYIRIKMRFGMVRQAGDIGFFAGEFFCQCSIFCAAQVLFVGVTPGTRVRGLFPATVNFYDRAIFCLGGYAEIVGQALRIYGFAKSEGDGRVCGVYIAALFTGGVVNQLKGVVKLACFGVVRVQVGTAYPATDGGIAKRWLIIY